jgi:cytochrome c553
VLPTLLLSGITGLGKTVLLLVAGLFIGWAIITAIFIPRRNQRFPRDLNLYLTLTAVLFVVQMGAVWWVTGTQDVEEAHAGEVTETTGGETETTGTEPTGTEPTETETGPTETETTETEPTETEATETTGSGGGNPAAGKEVFASAGCGGCHVLADAGSNGAVGPNLDESSPSFDKVVERVTNGQGAMPSFRDSLSEQQIADVAAYVSSVTDS